MSWAAKLIRVALVLCIALAAAPAGAGSDILTIRADSLERKEGRFLFDGNVRIRAGSLVVRSAQAAAEYKRGELLGVTVFKATIRSGARVVRATEARLAPGPYGDLVVQSFCQESPSRSMRGREVEFFLNPELRPTPGDFWTPEERLRLFQR